MPWKRDPDTAACRRSETAARWSCGQIAVADHQIRAAEQIAVFIHQLGVELLDDVHIAHRQQHIPVAIHNGNIAGRAFAAQHAGRAHVDSGFFTAFDDATSLHIVAHDGNQANRFAQSGQIFADIAANAAQRGMQRTGVGIPHDKLTIALAVDIHIRAADTGNITHGYGLQMLA